MVVGVCRLTLIHHAGNSLKAKRGVLRRIKDRVANRFNVSIAEVGANDLWRRIELGLAIAGNDGGHVNSQISKVENFIASLGLAEIVDSRLELIHFSDELGEMEFAFGEPDEDESGEGEPIDAGDIRGDDE
ncbi:MAG: DUF503 domain-containing protein [Myxococcota bacterium]